MIVPLEEVVDSKDVVDGGVVIVVAVVVATIVVATVVAAAAVDVVVVTTVVVVVVVVVVIKEQFPKTGSSSYPEMHPRVQRPLSAEQNWPWQFGSPNNFN